MADYVLPDDLIQMRRDFLAVQERLAAAGREMPSHAAVAAGEAEVTAEQKEAWWAAQDESRRLAVAMHGHPFWETVEAGDRKRVQAQLWDAAGG